VDGAPTTGNAPVRMRYHRTMLVSLLIDLLRAKRDAQATALAPIAEYAHPPAPTNTMRGFLLNGGFGCRRQWGLFSN